MVFSARFRHLFVLALVTVAVYGQLLYADFINFDDGLYVYDNVNVLKGITPDTFIWSLSSTDMGNWHPVTWWSHLLTIELFGLWPGGHHLVNLILHIFNTFLVYTLSRYLSAKPLVALSIALIFSIHPTHVESVAWISERKDVLCALFWLLGVNSYTKYRLGIARHGQYLSYIYFLAGLSCKPMIVTYPFVLLLVDLYLHMAGRINAGVFKYRSVVSILLPYSIPVIVVSLVTMSSQTEAGAIVQSGQGNYLYDMITNYSKYLLLFFYPVDLSVLYPYEKTNIVSAGMSACLLIFITLCVIFYRKKHPYLLFGFLWYCVTIFPVSGVVQIGNHTIADRYLYIPSVGIIFCLAMIVSGLLRKYSLHKKILVSVIVASLILQSYVYTRQWNNSISLYLESLDNSGPNPVLSYNLSYALRDAGLYNEALFYMDLYMASPLAVKAVGYNEKGVIYSMMGDKKSAKAAWLTAIRNNPDYEMAKKNLRKFY